MREIKFKAIINNRYCFHGSALTLAQITKLGEGFFYDDVGWLPYTGLKDKNGKEIYEGDLLLTPGGQKLPVVIREIAEGDAKFRLIGLNNCEVIGNIYENRELDGGNWYENLM